VVPALGHLDPGVRIEALHTAAAMDAAFGDERALAALDDVDPKVCEAALKALFDRGCTAPRLFAFCQRVLGGEDAMDEALARLVCSRLGACEDAGGRERCVELLLGALGDAGEEGGSWWSSLKRSVKGGAEQVSVRVAACQALGRLRAADAAEALQRVARESHPALKRAAQHALEQIRGS
jgi:hypothetical protein